MRGNQRVLGLDGHTDVQMPGTMDGLALSQYVRKRWPPTIIVVSSGTCTPREDEMSSGARFLPKPYVAQALIACCTTCGSSLRKLSPHCCVEEMAAPVAHRNTGFARAAGPVLEPTPTAEPRSPLQR